MFGIVTTIIVYSNKSHCMIENNTCIVNINHSNITEYFTTNNVINFDLLGFLTKVSRMLNFL